MYDMVVKARIRVYGCHSPVTTSNIPPATNKDEGNQRQGHSVFQQRCLPPDYHSQGIGPNYWNSQCSSSGNPTCSSVLQIPSSDKAFPYYLLIYLFSIIYAVISTAFLIILYSTWLYKEGFTAQVMKVQDPEIMF